MASFVMKQMVGGKINEMKGGLGKLTGEGEEKQAEGAEGAKSETGEDPEVVQARIEQEERRKEKHRQMEKEREQMRQGIREKYNIKKKEEMPEIMPDVEGRIGASRKKSPEELANEVHEDDDSILGQLGLGGAADKAKAAATSAVDTIKGFLPFGK